MHPHPPNYHPTQRHNRTSRLYSASGRTAPVPSLPRCITGGPRARPRLSAKRKTPQPTPQPDAGHRQVGPRRPRHGHQRARRRRGAAVSLGSDTRAAALRRLATAIPPAARCVWVPELYRPRLLTVWWPHTLHAPTTRAIAAEDKGQRK